jgi:uncharacterized protein YigE (DUF2233 family)
VRKLSAVLIALFVATSETRGEWRIITADTEVSAIDGVEHRHLVVQDSGGSSRATVDVALIAAKSAKLRLIDNPTASETLADAMQRRNCLAGVNGGYFDPNFKPIGLVISDGVILSPLTRARLLTGVLCSSDRGIEIVRLAEFSRRQKPNAAVECGPFLIDLGNRIRGLDQTRSARRTFAAVARGGNAALGVCSDLTLAQLSDALSSISLRNDFKTWRALNLDGGSSSAFWFARGEGDAFSIPEEKTVRDFVAVVPK